MSVYGYVRVSTVEQVSNTSLAEQDRRIHGVALFRGETIDAMFCDAGVTGTGALETRPEGVKLMAVLRRGDVIIVSKLDRAFRNASDALNKVQAWKAAGIQLVLADMGTEAVTENGVSKLMFTVLAAMAEWERERIIERITEGKRAKRAKGGYIGGNAPFGYKVSGVGREAYLIEDETEQKAISTIVLARRLGHSLRQISETVKAETGLAVSHEAVRRVLTSIESSAA